jgi:hypothetical protein
MRLPDLQAGNSRIADLSAEALAKVDCRMSIGDFGMWFAEAGSSLRFEGLRFTTDGYLHYYEKRLLFPVFCGE